MIRIIDEYLNSITMYKTVVAGLLLLIICAFIVSFMGVISFSPLYLFFSLSTLVLTCFVVNLIFGKIFKAPTNTESYLVTSFILFFLFSPPVDGVIGLIPLILASFIAMASKYIFAIKKKHLFNPAAIAAVIMGFLGFSVSWWIATPVLIPATLIVGLLIVRKVRKFSLFFTFSSIVVIEMIIFGFMYNTTPFVILTQLILSWPFLFFAAIMLTEPLTMPPTRNLQILYGGLIGFLFAFQIPLGFIHLSPEAALVIGNIYSYIVGSKQRVILTLSRIEKMSSSVYNFRFTPSEKLAFNAGQFAEWTLPHKNVDIRGNRRFFTIASSPTESEIMLGARITDDGSSFKKALLNFKKDDKISIGSLAGDFTLPENINEKLVFIAGGIGITPFRSMTKYIIDKNEKRDIVLIHLCSNPDDFVYRDVFNKASEIMNFKIIDVLSEKEKAPLNYRGLIGHVNQELISKNIPDFKERKFYISGSNVVVELTKSALFDLKVDSKNIVTDYFSGY